MSAPTAPASVLWPVFRGLDYYHTTDHAPNGATGPMTREQAAAEGTRPCPICLPPPGQLYRAAPADGWRVLDDLDHGVNPQRCTYDTGGVTYRGCNSPAVITGPRDQNRCARHLGGRWVEGGMVWVWIRNG